MSLSAKGNRGSWFAVVDGERLPCIHEYWLSSDGQYEDPGCMPGAGRWPKFIEAIESSRRVIVTRSRKTDSPDRKSGVSLARTAYLFVADVEQVEADEQSLRFKLRDQS